MDVPAIITIAVCVPFCVAMAILCLVCMVREVIQNRARGKKKLA